MHTCGQGDRTGRLDLKRKTEKAEEREVDEKIFQRKYKDIIVL